MTKPRFNPTRILREVASDGDATPAARVRAAGMLIRETAKRKRQAARPAVGDGVDPLIQRALAIGAVRRLAPDAMPTAGEHRGMPLHRYQDAERIEMTIRPALDVVLTERDPAALLETAADVMQPPEARLMAADILIAMHQASAGQHVTRGIDTERVGALVAGLDCLRWADPSRYASLIDQAGGAPRPSEHGAAVELACIAGSAKALAR